MTSLAALNASLTEREFAVIVYDLAKQLGWRRYHTYRSKRSPKGFPDEVLVRDRVIFVELKAEAGRPTAEQEGWMDALRGAGAETYLWRPSDLEELAAVLARRAPSAVGS